MESTPLTVQSIPLAKIRPNPKNPRKVKSEEAKDKKAKSLEANGQETPVKLRLLTPGERQADPAHSHELIDGELRYWGALKLGWTALDAIVFDIPAEDAQWKAVMSNEWEELHWLSRYEAIEDRLNSPSQPTQQQVADELGRSQQAISRVVSLMKVLNGNSRAQIYQALVKKDPSWELTEFPVYPLTALEDHELVEKALQVLIERQMTEKDAKKLVKWVKAGNDPASYGLKPGETASNGTEVASSSSSAYSAATPRNDSSLGPKDPYAAKWEGLPPGVKVTMTPKGYRMVMDLSPAEAVPVVYGALSNWEHLKGLSGEGQDLRYRNALAQVHQDAVPLRKKEVADKVQAEAERKAVLEAKAAEKTRKEVQRQAAQQAKADKVRSQSAVRSRQERQDQQPGEEALSGTGVAPAYAEASAGGSSPRQSPEALAQGDNDSDKNFIGKIGDFVQQKTGLTPQDLKEKAEGMLAKDAVQAANYQIRKGMRNILKDLF